MEWTWLQHPISLSLIAAIPGAIHGGISGAKKSWGRGVSDALTALIFAAAIAELLTPKEHPIAALLIGLVAGRTGAKALEALEQLVPDLVRELAMGWARRMVGSQGMEDTQPMPKEVFLEEDDDAEDARIDEKS